MNRLFRGSASTIFTRSRARPHHGFPFVFHDRADICEVEIHDPVQGDQIRDPLNALAQHVVGVAKGLHQRGLVVDHPQQVVVGNDDQRVHMLLQLGDASLRRGSAFLGFEVEG